MGIIPETLRAAVWFALCIFMALGMIIFAVMYAGLRITLKRITWKQVSFPELRFVR